MTRCRDLPVKDGSVRPDEDFTMDWEPNANRQKELKAIADAVKGAVCCKPQTVARAS